MRLLRRAHGNLPSANHGHGARDITSQLVGNKRAGVSRTRGVRSLTGRVVRADVASLYFCFIVLVLITILVAQSIFGV